MPPIEPNEPAEPNEDPGYEVLDDWNGPQTFRPRGSDRLAWYVRLFLIVIATALTTVFSLAAWIRPYSDDGAAKTMETHTQLGLPKCNMVVATGKPCPACGMTTSFSLLIHGDVVASLKANWVGTLLGTFCLGLIPWAAVGAWRGRYLFVRSAEMLTTIAVITLMVLMISRWAYIWFLQ